jgi:hypothetical protein
MDIIFAYGLKHCTLESVPDNLALKSDLDSLIERKMDVIRLYATKSSKVGKKYNRCNVTVDNLAKWCSHLGHEANRAWKLI